MYVIDAETESKNTLRAVTTETMQTATDAAALALLKPIVTAILLISIAMFAGTESETRQGFIRKLAIRGQAS